ncbi:hypothetical protein HS1genome_0084 [Sulfodiicoccus acidiphilus]|uniref:UPF0113 domain-containing protein n=1 Tax=Sulfodiicoccus acidiphilus TaxID=1670455 RepID=A0A348B0J3_9CREN|nr:tRNA pseudouridine(55) synthase TruB [Sulfodiicoccus acidiphilus]BBD71695.1 hypothetical protein HS1genome_0084 [Sulfodiicoccus acidiphilus]GGT86546.1 hypothetical protein GCM10007116_00620 [Sulfodiicoccus acidiphilus]
MSSIEVVEAEPGTVELILRELSLSYGCEFDELLRGYSFFLMIANFSQLFLTTATNVKKIVQALRGLKMHPYSIGIPVATLEPKVEPSLAFGEYMARACRKIVLDDSQLVRFLYGKSVKVDANSGLFVVVDRRGDFLGYGEVIPSGNLLRPLRDLGWYLRKGG